MKNIETNKYFAIMSEKDDVELMRIITVERADYQADAVIAAYLAAPSINPVGGSLRVSSKLLIKLDTEPTLSYFPVICHCQNSDSERFTF